MKSLEQTLGAPRRIDFVDSLRGLAILGVLLVHAGLATHGLPSAILKFTTAGQYGVQLFFVAKRHFHAVSSSAGFAKG